MPWEDKDLPNIESLCKLLITRIDSYAKSGLREDAFVSKLRDVESNSRSLLHMIEQYKASGLIDDSFFVREAMIELKLDLEDALS